MQYHKLGDTLKASFVTVNSSGVPTAADTTPTYTVFKNDTAVGSMTDVNATQVSTFRYRVGPAITTGNGFAEGDHIAVYVTAVVGSVSDTRLIAEYKVSAYSVEGVNVYDGAITSAKFTVSTITGVATGILEKIDQTWRRWFKRAVNDLDGELLKTYADDNVTVLTTQSLVVDDDAQTETQGAAS